MGVIDTSGACYSYAHDRIGQGRENATKYLSEHPALRADIENKVRGSLGLDPVPVRDTPPQQEKAEKDADK